MSMDKGLKARNALARHRNVLTRAERVEALKDIDAWDDEMPIFGLPKVAHRKAVTKKEKPAEEKAEGVEGVEGAPAEGAAETEEAPKAEKGAKGEKVAKAEAPKAEGKAKGKG